MKRKKIASFSNSLVKQTAEIAGRKQRPADAFFVAEGPHLAGAALDASVRVRELFYTEEFISTITGRTLVDRFVRSDPGPESIIELPAAVFSRMADTETPQGILAVVEIRQTSLKTLNLKGKALLVVCDGIQDPGNLGTMIRVSDAAGADAVILLPGTCDPYSAKTVRATAGSIFHIPVVYSGQDELRSYLSDKGIKLYAADAGAKMSLFETDLDRACALAFGNEAKGISAFIRNNADFIAGIPIPGKAESLNAAVSAAIFLYEAVRQRTEERGFKG